MVGRLDRVRAALAALADDPRPDALLVTAPANLRWLTGFTGSAGVLLVGPERALLATDGRYRTQAAEQLAASGVADQVDLTIGGVAGPTRGAGRCGIGCRPRWAWRPAT